LIIYTKNTICNDSFEIFINNKCLNELLNRPYNSVFDIMYDNKYFQQSGGNDKYYYKYLKYKIKYLKLKSHP